MAGFTAEQTAALKSLRERVDKRLKQAAAQRDVEALRSYFAASERQLIAVINGRPPSGEGHLEFGAVPYIVQNFFPKELDWVSRIVPGSALSSAEWQRHLPELPKGSVVLPDGTLLGFSTFEQLDFGWAFSTVLYLLTHLGEIKKAPFGVTPLVKPITGKKSLRIALLGDWGTGAWNDNNTTGPAMQIMQDLQKLSPAPDVVIHLGDVYYSGTGKLPLWVNLVMSALGDALKVTFDPNEENHRLLQDWWPQPSPLSLTLNSNHEMYSAAHGLFHALGGGGGTPFSVQQGTSYFALTFEDCVILGLDSGYCSESSMYMQGRLQNSGNTIQTDWIKSLKLAGKKVIALTHHNPLSYDGKPQGDPDSGDPLHQDLAGALGRDPDYWYWGHIHNGIVYTDKVGFKPGTTTSTRCRCLGHAALPFGCAYYSVDGKAYELDRGPHGTNPKIAYFAHTKLQASDTPLVWKNRVKNGFAVLTLAAGSVAEAFYEQGNPQPVWTSRPKAAGAGT